MVPAQHVGERTFLGLAVFRGVADGDERDQRYSSGTPSNERTPAPYAFWWPATQHEPSPWARAALRRFCVAALPSSTKYVTLRQKTTTQTGAWAMNLP